MTGILNKKTILWDFDGVILDSMPVRELGFKKVLSEYSENEVKRLLQFHKKNAGLSRYVKFRFFFEEVLHESITEIKLMDLADKYSKIMRSSLTSRENIIQDSLVFIKKHSQNYYMHLVSGSDENELRFLCQELDISSFFRTIEGSPTPKTELVKGILEKFKYVPSETCLIGDSLNDFDAATRNSIDFFGYNNEDLRGRGKAYIESFKSL